MKVTPLAALALFASPLFALAHPVAYEGATIIQFYTDTITREGQLYYSVKPYLALGARHIEMSLPHRESKIHLAGANFLLKRWNATDSQANIYLSTGYGIEEVGGKGNSGIGLLDADIDWESRKYYVAVLARTLQFSDFGPTHTYIARAGIAPYLAEYGEIQSFLILEASRTVEARRVTEITPMVRVFYKNVLWEIGRGFSGDWKFNLMVHL